MYKSLGFFEESWAANMVSVDHKGTIVSEQTDGTLAPVNHKKSTMEVEGNFCLDTNIFITALPGVSKDWSLTLLNELADPPKSAKICPCSRNPMGGELCAFCTDPGYVNSKFDLNAGIHIPACFLVDGKPTAELRLKFRVRSKFNAGLLGALKKRSGVIRPRILNLVAKVQSSPPSPQPGSTTPIQHSTVVIDMNANLFSVPGGADIK